MLDQFVTLLWETWSKRVYGEVAIGIPELSLRARADLILSTSAWKRDVDLLVDWFWGFPDSRPSSCRAFKRVSALAQNRGSILSLIHSACSGCSIRKVTCLPSSGFSSHRSKWISRRRSVSLFSVVFGRSSFDGRVKGYSRSIVWKDSGSACGMSLLY